MKLISFSGLDGSGKTTQIDGVIALLQSRGLTVRRLAFWDHVVVATRYRSGFVHKVYKSEPGVGSPDRPVNRRDKNVRAWHLTLVRHLLYLLDILHLRWVIARERRRPADILVMDRYIYDELANLPLRNPLSRAFVRFAARIAPEPDLALLLDADPDAARARKPEYPVEFMRECRGWYHALAALLTNIIVVPPLPLAEARAAVDRIVLHTIGDDEALFAAPRPA
ncbi:MAG: dTMP kinase [Terriglobales bacterium]